MSEGTTQSPEETRVAEYTSLFRTHQEMMQISEERHKDKNYGPYVVEGEKDGRLLVFVGVSHSNDPNHRQWSIVKAKWQDFVSHKNPSKHLFIEGGIRPISDDLDSAIVNDGDPGFVQYHAQNDNVTFSSVEPDRVEEVEHLLEGFSQEEVMAYYFARQVEAWARGYKDSESDWRKFVQPSMDRYKTIEALGGLDLSVDNLIKIYEKVFGHKFNPEDRVKLNDESNPGLNPVASACNDLRDSRLMQGILEKYESGHDAFINYGSGHAITMEPAIRELLK